MRVLTILLLAVQGFSTKTLLLIGKMNIALHGTPIGPYFFMGLGAVSLWFAVFMLLIYMYVNREILL